MSDEKNIIEIKKYINLFVLPAIVIILQGIESLLPSFISNIFLRALVANITLLMVYIIIVIFAYIKNYSDIKEKDFVLKIFFSKTSFNEIIKGLVFNFIIYNIISIFFTNIPTIITLTLNCIINILAVLCYNTIKYKKNG